ncbi:MAG: type II CAAX endopeptidase family protein [Verrucomicrobiota bacterium]
MAQAQSAESLATTVLAAAIVAVCFWIYLRIFRPLLAGRGKVSSEAFGIPDAMLVTLLVTWLGGLAMRGFMSGAKARPMTNADVIQSAILFGVIVGGIAVFLKIRQVGIRELFGFGRVKLPRALGTGIVLLLAAYPLIALCSAITQSVLGDKAEPQEIVKYFQEAANRSDRWSLILTAFVGVFVAPFAEEFIFRGYIYGVIKRYLGVPVGLVFNALLFGAIHLNAPALPSLFVLALCFTLAYEATGSLLVPMIMHGLFNAVMLGAIFYSS